MSDRPFPRSPRIMVFGAHPDDAEYHAGGLLWRQAARGATIRIVSVTNGAAGHHRMHPSSLAARRRAEARAVGQLLGADYVTWDWPDAQLEVTLPLREQIIREIRQFRPDLVLTHRPFDYHPDHRAVATAVQDACYLVTVPLVVPDTPHLERDAVVAYLCDLFTRPAAMRPDVVLDVTQEVDAIVELLSCHESQFFEFLPYNHHLGEVPAEARERKRWLRECFRKMVAPRVERFREALRARFGKRADSIEVVEVYEISEYARQPAPGELEWLFPQGSGDAAANQVIS